MTVYRSPAGLFLEPLEPALRFLTSELDRHLVLLACGRILQHFDERVTIFDAIARTFRCDGDGHLGVAHGFPVLRLLEMQIAQPDEQIGRASCREGGRMRGSAR